MHNASRETLQNNPPNPPEETPLIKGEARIDGAILADAEWDATATDSEARLLEQLHEYGVYPVREACPECGYRVCYGRYDNAYCVKCGIDNFPVSEEFKAQVKGYPERSA